MLDFLTLQTTTENPNLLSIIYTVALCFFLSSMIAITYEKTFQGLSYSRNYVQSLVLSSIVAATIMQAIGDSLARGLGMIGALAIIRFRTTFRDPRDIIFMFAALATGISCGVMSFMTGIIGSLSFCIVAFILHWIPFGKNRSYDGLMKFVTDSQMDDAKLIENIMRKYCQHFALVSINEIAQGSKLDYTYHIKLKKINESTLLVKSLGDVNSIEKPSLLLQETTVEI
jgi:uncharacterized membrane protein YhiD involved in acid resistance